MTRVIHTGDTHLGYQQYHSETRREDFLAAFRTVLEDAIEAEVAAVVHAGDLFHSRRPDLEDLVGTIEALSTLEAADIPFYAVVGNHEGTHTAQWVDLFESLGLATRLGTDPELVDDVALYGLDYLPEARRDTEAYTFEPVRADHHLLVAHGAFSPFPYGSWDLETVLEVAPVDFDAVLLGDNHEPLRRTVDGVPVAYCGSTERVSADEREPRGYNVVTAADTVQLSRKGVSTRSFVYVDVDLGAGEGTARVRERVREEAVEDAVVIVTIEGDGDRVVPAEIEAFAEERGALVTRVNDRRDRAEEAGVDVEFADPRSAIESRVRELGLSPAARQIDDTIRTGDVPDSNVGDVVEESVRAIVDDPDAFESGGDDGATDGSDTGDADGQVTMEEYQ